MEAGTRKIFNAPKVLEPKCHVHSSSVLHFGPESSSICVLDRICFVHVAGSPLNKGRKFLNKNFSPKTLKVSTLKLTAPKMQVSDLQLFDQKNFQ